ncbi:MAG: hypothetical protein Q4G59_05940, partial [Planctomycetia bacterium]|nr:hypothetical protein [Planctomycetia bacterium]
TTVELNKIISRIYENSVKFLRIMIYGLLIALQNILTDSTKGFLRAVRDNFTTEVQIGQGNPSIHRIKCSGGHTNSIDILLAKRTKRNRKSFS